MQKSTTQNNINLYDLKGSLFAGLFSSKKNSLNLL
jgi:hypothetical protein